MTVQADLYATETVSAESDQITQTIPTVPKEASSALRVRAAVAPIQIVKVPLYVALIIVH